MGKSLLAKLTQEVLARGAGAAALPFGGLDIILGAFRAVRVERSEKQEGIGGHHKGRNVIHRLIVPDLSVGDPEVLFLVAMVDFDLPTIQVGLDEEVDG